MTTGREAIVLRYRRRAYSKINSKKSALRQLFFVLDVETDMEQFVVT